MWKVQAESFPPKMVDWSQQWYNDLLSIVLVKTKFCGLAMTENKLYNPFKNIQITACYPDPTKSKPRLFINTIVNHRMTVQQMLDLYPREPRWEAVFIRFYETDLTAEIHGKTWSEIAEDWEAESVKCRIMTWMEWS